MAKTKRTVVGKISISLRRDDLDWAQRRAKHLRRTLSSVIGEALQEQRQREARWRVLDQLGGTADITPEAMDAVRREIEG